DLQVSFCFIFVIKSELFFYYLFSVARVTCVFSQSCVLPCSDSSSSDVINWSRLTPADGTVHCYYGNQDQLGQQDQNFRGRTSLFTDQISRGNASLLLTGVKVQDEGTYRCNTSGNKLCFIAAPVSDIRIHQDGNRITCSSEGIYPQPELTWSTEPPSNTALQNRTTVHQTEEKLYNISSSLTGPDGPDLTYSCSIRTRSSRRRATLHKLSKNQNQVVLKRKTGESEDETRKQKNLYSAQLYFLHTDHIFSQKNH
uniref:Ig-like domain-containing protein n=1 Tax=Poecilia mexicana TaxID=48701 RepID=A0A3B3WE24_9TELE